MRGLGSHTRQDYIRHVRRFAAFLGRAPDTATVEDIRRFQLHQHENGVGPATINSTVSALRFLFTVTLKRRDLARALVITRNPRKLPDVLSIEEAARLLEAAPGIKYKAALGVAYGASLRVSEVAHLKVDGIDSTRMLTAGRGNNEPGECVMTRHGRSIHMVYSPQSWPTGRFVPVPMARAFSGTNVLSFTPKIRRTTPASPTLEAPGLTIVAAIGRPLEATKPHSSEKCRPRVPA